MPTGASRIDPVNRIEGHLRIDVAVRDGFVSDAWVSGGLFRGMELVLQRRTPADAALIAQRICGVCPVSHAHASCMASEQALGIKIPQNARIIRNILEGAQFLHSHILWFYHLASLDYVNPLHGVQASIPETMAYAEELGTSVADFAHLAKRLEAFLDNGQLSLFSGNWFDAKDHEGNPAYRLPAELDLIVAAHYFEALEMQAMASEISALIGGKMPHVMSSLPGGTTWVPTVEKLDDLLYRARCLRDWVYDTLLPDTLAIAPYYMEEFRLGSTAGNYLAWGVFDSKSGKADERYLPGGVWSLGESRYKTVRDGDESLVTETTVHAFYDPAVDNGKPRNPSREGVTAPLYSKEYLLSRGAHPARGMRYTWSKAPRYDGRPFETGALARLLVAYQRGIGILRLGTDSLLEALSPYAPQPMGLGDLNSTMGRVAARSIETAYVADLMLQWIEELIAALKEGDSTVFTSALTEEVDAAGIGLWEAPRGALYHSVALKEGVIDAYQIVIPSTWNISPRDERYVRGPLEQALVGSDGKAPLPVEDLEKPIHVLRAVHSFDPCVACAVHIIEPATGKEFSTSVSPWGQS